MQQHAKAMAFIILRMLQRLNLLHNIHRQLQVVSEIMLRLAHTSLNS